MKKPAKFLGISVSLAIFLASIWVVLNTQAIFDWWILRNYEPSPAVASLATDSSLNDEGRRLFYIYDPQLLDKDSFQGKCTVGEETIVLGCYIASDKIYVLDVDDPRLEGVEEVTAAHEMLHAVYDRMSMSERQDIDKLVVDYYTSLNNEKLNQTIESYRIKDPSVVPNELHSILGTEYGGLPEALEAHYRKYFVDRQTVVALSQKYDTEFTKREDQIKKYDTQLTLLNTQIEELQTNLEFKSVALQTEQKNLESLRGDTDSFNAAVVVYNANVNQFNRDLERLTSMIDEYNKIVKDRNVIAIEEQDLVKAIDTRLSEIE